MGPKLYGLCLVKNEDDVIAQSLTHALKYCDQIVVIDNGSTDNTWSIVQSLARKHQQIAPLLQTHESFANGLRAIAYNEYHSTLSEQDWWLILDSDEFLAEDPLPVIEQARREKSDLIGSWQIHFYFTDVDYQAWLDGKDNRDVSILERRRYYLINWQETRLFRNDPRIRWDGKINGYYPNHLKRFASRLILNRHYQFRDPEQIQKRLLLRFGNPLFPHVQNQNWNSVIVPSKKLNYYHKNEPWRFSMSGLAQYYSIVARNLCRAAARKVGKVCVPDGTSGSTAS